MDPVTPLTKVQEQAQEASAAHEGYLHRVIEEIDVTANVVTGGNQDETISSRAARADMQGKKWGRWLSAALNLFQRNHGAKAEAGDLERAAHVEYLERHSGALPE